MKRIVAIILACLVAVSLGTGLLSTPAFADKTQKTVYGKSYELGEDDKYELSKALDIDAPAARLYVEGDISSVSENNGFVSFAVNSDNMAVMIDKQFGLDLFEQEDAHEWHIVSDKTKVVDATELSQRIGTGAIIVQTSKDGKTWITTDSETDIYNKWDTINNRNYNGEPINAFYRTTNVQLVNGCYYRIIVAYKLQREIDPSQFLFISKKNLEEKERLEIYQFYAYDPSVNRAEILDTSSAYEFSDVWRVDSQDGFKNPQLIKDDDPHIDWVVGRFFVSGYTDNKMDGDVPVFLKVPEDRAALWFVLEQELDKCNGDTGIKVNYIDSGSDIYFGTPAIKDFGRGALIIRKTDKQNQKERQIYTNYLEASATVGANTRVDLFEEGDYEVALDYQLHYDKPFVFGRTTTKTFTYRVFFKFKVRNGDIPAFIRDVATDQFITNANVAPKGFYIDVANSQYLTMSIKREVLSEGLDGLVEDTKFSGVAKEKRPYTEEGIYTVTIKNRETGDVVTKRVYVGDRDILLVHMKTGMTISEINERLAAGAYINDQGQLIDPTPVVEEEILEVLDPEEDTSVIPTADNQEPPVLEDVTMNETKADMEEEQEDKSEEAAEEEPINEPEAAAEEVSIEEANNSSTVIENDQPGKKPKTVAIISVAIVLLASVFVSLSRKTKKKTVGKKED